MDWCFSSLLWTFLVLCLLVHVVCFIFGDADVTLQVFSLLGHKPECQLRGLVVWVTGASSGIGEELAYQLAKCGTRLVLSARREDQLNRVKQKCLKISSLKNEDILVLPLDLLDRKSHEEKTKTVIENFGHIDVLINNGGRSQRSLFLETRVEVYEALMELNFLGTVSLTKQVLPHMTQRGSGSVVTVSSVAGLAGVPLSTGYSASKHALQGFFNSLRTELRDFPNILISMVCPGPVQSDIVNNAFTEELNKVTFHFLSKPLSTCLFLLSLFSSSACGRSWQPGAQDVDESLCAFDAVGNVKRFEGNVDRPAALPDVLLRLAVRTDSGLGHDQPAGQEKGAELQSRCGRGRRILH